jgi:hypothetical protein
MAGVFDILPVKDDPETSSDEENPGKGRFHAGVVNSGGSGEFFGTERFVTGVVYDHRVPGRSDDKSTEAFLIFDLVQNDVLIFSNNAHIQASQSEKTDPAGKAYLEKTVKSAEEQKGTGDSGIENDFFQQYVGRFRDGADFWSGSAFARDRGVVTRDVEDICAQISTGEGAADANCADLGIGIAGETFLDLAADADVVFPADFPAIPTF